MELSVERLVIYPLHIEMQIIWVRYTKPIISTEDECQIRQIFITDLKYAVLRDIRRKDQLSLILKKTWRQRLIIIISNEFVNIRFKIYRMAESGTQ